MKIYKCFSLLNRHFYDPHSCRMLSLLRKYCGYHKSVARTIVRHRVAHYVLVASPPRAREDPGSDYPIGTGFPFVDRHSSVFSRRILLYLPLVSFCSRTAASFRPSHAVLWERRDKDDQVEE